MTGSRRAHRTGSGVPFPVLLSSSLPVLRPPGASPGPSFAMDRAAMHLSRRLGRAALVCLAGAVAAPSLAAQRPSDVSPTPEVRKLELNGVENVDAAELEQSIATTATRCR